MLLKKKGFKKNITLRLKMFIFSFFIVLFSVFTSGFIMLHNISDAFEMEFGSRAMAIARTVAQHGEIQQTVGTAEGLQTIQPIAERIRLATAVDYIVIFSMDGIRYSHPSEAKVGSVYEGIDQTEALSQHEYLSKAYGVQGYSIRAFVPVMNVDGTRQVGVVNVGILSPKWYHLIQQYRFDIAVSVLCGLFIGLVGSILVANHLKRQTLNLEPYEIARIVEERSNMMQAMDIGILATDEHDHITFINRLGRQYTHFFGTSITLKELFKNTWIAEEKLVRQESYRPLFLHDQVYLVRTFPIHVHERLVGHLLMMTNQREAQSLAEELTGIKVLVDSLRAQQHEYMNRLHSIAGLIQLDRQEEALSLIIDEITDEEELIQTLRDKIFDYSIQGLLLGKHSRAKELGISLTIDDTSLLMDFKNGLASGDLVTIIGNLLDNAMEACLGQETRDVHLTLQGDKHFLFIEVQDSGCGIRGNPQKIFEYGFSTKMNEGRGIGLALIKQLVEANKGVILIDSVMDMGTTMTIKMGVE